MSVTAPSSSESSVVVVFDHRDGKLVRSWRATSGGEPEPWDEFHSGADLRSVLPEAADREPASWIGWRRVSADVDAVAAPRWDPARHSSVCLHAGLGDAERAALSHLGFIEQMDAVWKPNAARSGDWLVSADAGLVHGSELARVGWWRRAPSLQVALLDFGRRASRDGVLCLVENSLGVPSISGPPSPVGSVAGLVRRCHGVKWLLFWAGCRALYGPGRLTVGLEVLRTMMDRTAASLSATASAPRTYPGSQPDLYSPEREGAVSVVVPTLGRPDSIAALLRDLAAQSIPVHEVVVVAQGGGGEPPGDLPTDPPYALQWIAVDWSGACRSRNLAISRTTGDWLLLLDDDVRCPPDFLRTMLSEVRRWGLDAASARVWTPSTPVAAEEKFANAFPASRLDGGDASGPDWMWPGFAGCASMVRAEFARRVDGFDERLDLGYGEDFEFGLRLREAGARFLHVQRPYVVHYHEPVGGFRTPAKHPWHAEEEPKPSPYILLSRSGLHRACRRGYAWTYLQGALRSARWPWRAVGVLRRWRAARHWATRLAERPLGGIRAWQQTKSEGSSRPGDDR